MKLFNVLFYCLFLTFLILDCSSNTKMETTLVKNVLDDSFNAMEAFVLALDSASNDNEIIVAISSYENRLDALASNALKLQALNITINTSNPPKELEEIIGKIKYMTVQFMHSYQKIIDNLDNPDVSEALNRMLKKNSEIHALQL